MSFSFKQLGRPSLGLPPLHSGDSGGIQTHNLLIRSQMLYSVELRNHSVFAVAKVRTFSQLTKLFTNFFQKKCFWARFWRFLGKHSRLFQLFCRQNEIFFVTLQRNFKVFATQFRSIHNAISRHLQRKLKIRTCISLVLS